MNNNFVQVNGLNFSIRGKDTALRGFALGSWLNTEHFMIGLPGTESQLRTALCKAYGEANVKEFWEKFWHVFVAEDDFRLLKSTGVNVLRIPFNYRLFEKDSAPYEYDDSGFRHLDRALALCEKYEIYAILDLHAAPGGQNPDWHADNALGETLLWKYADFQKRLICLWEYIAKRYRDNPWIAGYDLLNEPCAEESEIQVLIDFYNKLITKIREIDAHHILFLEGNMYASNFRLFSPCSDPNVAYSFHFYPYLFQLQPDSGNQIERLEAILLGDCSLKEYQDRLGRPLWCGETGVFRSLIPAERIEMFRNILRTFEKNGISWTIWTYKDVGDLGVVFPGESSSWKEFSLRAFGNWNLHQDFIKAPEIVEGRLSEYSGTVSEKLKQKLKYRYLAERQYILSEVYNTLFKEIPFKDLLEYLDSFLFKNCEVWQEGINAVKEQTGV